MPKISLKTGLIEIGFTPQEASVYLSLITHSPCTAGPIISETKLHRNVVYTALDHLAGKKLISERLVNGRKRFAVASPAPLVQDYENKARLAQELSKEITSLTKQELQEITIHQGNDEYLNLLTGILQSLPKNSTIYVLGTGGEAFMRQTMLLIWDQYHEVAHARHLQIKMLGYEPQRSAIAPSADKEGNYEVRYLPANMENPAGIHIYPDAGIVLNIIYSDEQNPVTAIKIKNQSLTRGYLNLFENLWVMGKE